MKSRPRGLPLSEALALMQVRRRDVLLIYGKLGVTPGAIMDELLGVVR